MNHCELDGLHYIPVLYDGSHGERYITERDAFKWCDVAGSSGWCNTKVD